MKVVFLLGLSVVALCGSVANAWTESDRCKNRRELSGYMDDEESPRDLSEHPVSTNDGELLRDLSEEPVDSLKTNLRGSEPNSHRKLGIYTFQLKLHHEPGYCWQVRSENILELDAHRL